MYKNYYHVFFFFCGGMSKETLSLSLSLSLSVTLSPSLPPLIHQACLKVLIIPMIIDGRAWQGSAVVVLLASAAACGTSVGPAATRSGR